MREKLFVIFGAGNDAVGLVQQVTTPIAGVNGNILDLRQDVIHGLFTLFLVVDLSQCELPIDRFKELVGQIAEDTGLDLAIDKYTPVPRSSDRKNLLLILVGRDKPGIVSRISEQLSHYRVNIEFSQMIARTGVFLMELHADVTQAALPLENLISVLQQEMQAVDISTMFQSEDVFNKKKRVVCFDLSASFIAPESLGEILKQTGIEAEEIGKLFPVDQPHTAVRKAAELLQGLPGEVATRVAEAIDITAPSVELIETLKIMGYKVVLNTTAFGFFTEILVRKAALDGCYGYEVLVDDDSQALTGELSPDFEPLDRGRLSSALTAREGVAVEDIAIIGDDGAPGTEETPGIRIDFNMRVLLDYVNQRILSREHLLGMLGSFGIPRS